jgi:hypothetical protein
VCVERRRWNSLTDLIDSAIAVAHLPLVSLRSLSIMANGIGWTTTAGIHGTPTTAVRLRKPDSPLSLNPSVCVFHLSPTSRRPSGSPPVNLSISLSLTLALSAAHPLADFSAQTFYNATDALVALGFRDAGYEYINVCVWTLALVARWPIPLSSF